MELNKKLINNKAKSCIKKVKVLDKCSEVENQNLGQN